MTSKQEGFTLVEIAIVLVIIGLLLGGILKGQEMIAQAKIKNVVADFSGISAAYYGYQDRYRAIPGDDPNADTRWTSPTAATKGNGDGVVAGWYNDTATQTLETHLWWDHLRRAGFVAGSGTIQPFNSLVGMIGVQTGNGGDGGTTPTIGAALGGFVSLIVCSANLTDKIAIAVDTQMDDGAIGTGGVRGQLHTTGPNPKINSGADSSAYAETGTNLYTLCRAL